MAIGTLFTVDFLNEGLPVSPVWAGASAPDAAAPEATIIRIARRVSTMPALGKKAARQSMRNASSRTRRERDRI
jgi:hypothetical protein